MDIKERIFDCMNRAFAIENANEEISQKSCETWDSLNHLNLIAELEEEFDIELEPEEIGLMVDFVSVKKIIENKL